MSDLNAPKLTIVAGRVNSGKTAYVYDRVAEIERKKEPSILIVPPNYTYESEKSLCEILGGIQYTSVCSFFSLERKVLKEGGRSITFFSELGNIMLTRKCIECASLEIFRNVSHKTGFAQECLSLISKITADGKSVEDLRTAADSMDDTLLKRKLYDLIEICELTAAHLAEKGISESDAHNAFIECIPESKLCNSHIFIDNIDVFSQQNMAVVAALAKCAKSVTVSVCADLSGNVRDYGLFKIGTDNYVKLKKLADEGNMSVDVVRLHNNGRQDVKGDLRHMEHELFAFPFIKYSGRCESIEIFAAPDKTAEILAVTAAVADAARAGTRYREMAILAAKESEYAIACRRELEKAKIPVFSDSSRSLGSMAISVLIICALKAATNGYAKQELSKLMKCGLCGITRDEAELLENYLDERGIRGSALRESFSTKPDDEKFNRRIKTLESARKKLIEPLKKLQEGLRRGNVKTKTEALYSYLEDVCAADALEKTANNLKSQGLVEKVDECRQVWDSVVEILTQLHDVMGDIEVSNARFISIITEGLESQSVSVIPAGLDMVLFGSIDRTVLPKIKRLFIIGATDDALPPLRLDNGTINDSEQEELSARGIDLCGTSEHYRHLDMQKEYKALSCPTEKLYISYPARSGDGESHPSPLVERLRKVFPSLDKSDTPRTLPNADALATALRGYCDTGKMSDSDKELLAWYRSDEKWSAELDKMIAALFFSYNVSNLDSEFARRLYGNGLFGSVTRLEKFNSCPFAHFASYGLKAREHREFTEKKDDIGTFYHSVLDAFVKYVLDNQIDCEQLSADDCDEILEKNILPDIIKNFNFGMLLASARSRARLRSYVRTVKYTVIALVKQLRLGSFRFDAAEVVFGKDGIYPPIELELPDGQTFCISGKIDRIDVFGDGDERGVRIIDYKLGGKRFDITDLYEGLELQLPIYLSALSTAQSCFASGMFYMPVDMPKLEKGKLPTQIEEEILKQFRLRGLFLSEVSVLEALDSEFATGEAKASSVVHSAKFNKNGELSLECGAVTREQMERVMQFARKRAAQTASDLMSGKIKPEPYARGKKTPCRYCQYKSICRFDKKIDGCSYRTINKVRLADLFDDPV